MSHDNKPAASIEYLDDDQLDAVSGGARADWEEWGKDLGAAGGGLAGGAAGGPWGAAGGTLAGGAAGKATGGFLYDNIYEGNGGADWSDQSFSPMGDYTGY